MRSILRVLGGAAALGCVALLGLLLAGCASTPAPTQHTAVDANASAPTVAHMFRIYRADGTSAVPVAQTRGGSCFTGSIATPVAGAYRCFAGNAILDPCFTPPTGTSSVLCVADPWSQATRLTLSGALPATGPVSTHPRPWAIRLAGGARCVTVTGTVSVVHRVAYSYVCRGGGLATQPSGAGTERVRYLAPHANAPQTAAVTDTWVA